MIARSVQTLSKLCSNAGMAIASVLLVYVVVHIILEIVLRNFFHSSTNTMAEFVGYATGGMTFLALGHTFASRKHVRVGVLRQFWKGKLAIWIELLCLAFTFGAYAFMARYVFLVFMRDFSRGSMTPGLVPHPTWYIAALIFVGLMIFLLQLVASAIDTLINGVPEEQVEGE